MSHDIKWECLTKERNWKRNPEKILEVRINLYWREKRWERSKNKKGGSLTLTTLNKKLGPQNYSIPGSSLSGPSNTFYSQANPIYDKLLDSLKLLFNLFIIYSILFNLEQKNTEGGAFQRLAGASGRIARASELPTSVTKAPSGFPIPSIAVSRSQIALVPRPPNISLRVPVENILKFTESAKKTLIKLEI